MLGMKVSVCLSYGELFISNFKSIVPLGDNPVVNIANVSLPYKSIYTFEEKISALKTSTYTPILVVSKTT